MSTAAPESTRVQNTFDIVAKIAAGVGSFIFGETELVFTSLRRVVSTIVVALTQRQFRKGCAHDIVVVTSRKRILRAVPIVFLHRIWLSKSPGLMAGRNWHHKFVMCTSVRY